MGRSGRRRITTTLGKEVCARVGVGESQNGKMRFKIKELCEGRNWGDDKEL